MVGITAAILARILGLGGELPSEMRDRCLGRILRVHWSKDQAVASVMMLSTHIPAGATV